MWPSQLPPQWQGQWRHWVASFRVQLAETLFPHRVAPRRRDHTHTHPGPACHGLHEPEQVLLTLAPPTARPAHKNPHGQDCRRESGAPPRGNLPTWPFCLFAHGQLSKATPNTSLGDSSQGPSSSTSANRAVPAEGLSQHSQGHHATDFSRVGEDHRSPDTWLAPAHPQSPGGKATRDLSDTEAEQAVPGASSAQHAQLSRTSWFCQFCFVFVFLIILF